MGEIIMTRAMLGCLAALALAASAGMINRWERARAAVEAGLTSPAEVRRVLGISEVDTHQFEFPSS